MIAEQLRMQLLPPVARPGADWTKQKPYRDERGKSAPAEIEIDGVVYQYIDGSLLDGEAKYRVKQDAR